MEVNGVPYGELPTREPVEGDLFVGFGADGNMFAVDGARMLAGKIPVETVENPGASVALSFADVGSKMVVLTPTQATVLSLAKGDGTEVQQLILSVEQPASGGFAVTLPPGASRGGSVLYPGSTPPTVDTTAGAVTRIMFETNGTTTLGGV